MTRCLACSMLLSFFIPCCFAADAAAQDAEFVARFMREAPAAWGKGLPEIEYAQGPFDLTIRNGETDFVGNEEGEITLHFDYSRNKHCRSLLIRIPLKDDEEGPFEAAYIQNAEYVLEIDRASSDQPWRLNHAGKDWSDADHFTSHSLRWWPDKMGLLGHKIGALWQLATNKELPAVSEFVKDPRIAISDIQILENDHWRVTFAPDAAERTGVDSLERAVLDFDPGHNWRQVRGEYFGKSLRHTIYEFEYSANEQASIDLPARTHLIHSLRDEESGEPVEQFRFIFEFDLAVREELPPDSEFRAAAFGLPEPDID